MRILKEGRLPYKETVLTCKVCNTVFAFFKSDILISKRKLDRSNVYYLTCPLCNQVIVTDEESYKALV